MPTYTLYRRVKNLFTIGDLVIVKDCHIDIYYGNMFYTLITNPKDLIGCVGEIKFIDSNGMLSVELPIQVTYKTNNVCLTAAPNNYRWGFHPRDIEVVYAQ